MPKLTLNDVTSGYSAATVINANNDRTEAALENTLSRDGSTPNGMNASLDMNSNRVVNLGSPQSGTDAARWADVTDGVDLTGAAVPSQTGNADRALFTDGTNLAFRKTPYIHRDADEVTAGITPSDYSYYVGDVRRYGAVADDTTDSRSAIQTAWNFGATYRVPIYMPGQYVIGAALVAPNFLTVVGDGWRESQIRANGSFAIITNSSATDCKQIDISGVKLKAGTHGVNLSTTSGTGTVSLWNLRDVRFEDNTVCGFLCDGNLIANNFVQVMFDSTLKGIRVTTSTANLNSFEQCRFEEMDDTSVSFAAGEANTFNACRFEARNTTTATGGTVLSLTNCKATEFIGCYFEDTFVNVLTEVSSTSTTAFRSCRFTGAENSVAPAGFKRETFVSDGIVTFSNCQFNASSDGSAKMLLIGNNPGLLYNNATNAAVTTLDTYKDNSLRSIGVTTKSKTSISTGTAFDVLTFARPAAASSRAERQVMSGTMLVTAFGTNNSGDPFVFSRTYNVRASGYATTTIDIGATSLGNSDSLGATGATLTFATKAGASSTSATLQATLTCTNLESVEFTVELNFLNSCNATRQPMTLAVVL